jgi:zinc protease
MARPGMAHLLGAMDFIETNDVRTADQKTRLWRMVRCLEWDHSEDRTNSTETLTATDENLKWALDLEAARLVNVEDQQANCWMSEMTVVRNEFERGENSPQRVTQRARRIHRVPSGQLRVNRPSARAKDLEKVPAERLAAF